MIYLATENLIQLSKIADETNTSILLGNNKRGWQEPRWSCLAQMVDTAIADTVYATRCIYNSALKTTPGGLAFGRDMILNIPLVTDFQQLQKRRQDLIDKRLLLANAKRYSRDYTIGDEVLKLVYQPDKLDPRATGPYRIDRVHTNGTITIELSPGVLERINIRRVKPYRRWAGFFLPIPMVFPAWGKGRFFTNMVFLSLPRKVSRSGFFLMQIEGFYKSWFPLAGNKISQKKVFLVPFAMDLWRPWGGMKYLGSGTEESWLYLRRQRRTTDINVAINGRWRTINCTTPIDCLSSLHSEYSLSS